MEFSNKYILGFALLICLVLSLAVSSLSVGMRERIATNKDLFKQLNVLRAAGIVSDTEKPSPEEIVGYFANIEALVIDRKTGEVLGDEDANALEPLRLAADPDTSEETPAQHKGTRVARLSDKLVVYEIKVPGSEGVVLPIHGNGLWSTMYGFLALSPDGMMVKGITYYDQAETPGLGGEVDNPAWKAQWPGMRAFQEDGKTPMVTVVKSGMVTDNTYQVDGMSGATITSRGVAMMVDLWLGEHGYGAYLAKRPKGLSEDQSKAEVNQ